MNITILGDSYAVDIPHSWASILSQQHNVTCLSQAGCSEYKIWLQSQNVPADTDLIIISHTSWSRIPVETHPVHTEGFHVNCDLIYNDCDAHNVTTATDFFENHFWNNFWFDTYWLWRDKLSYELSSSHWLVELDFFQQNRDNPALNFYQLAKNNPGKICHMSETGNRMVADHIMAQLELS